MTPVLIGLAASAMTLAGGLIALRWRNRLALALGLAAGVVLGVALFDLLPEAIELGTGTVELGSLFVAVASGFGVYLLLDRSLRGGAPQAATWRRHLAPATLTMHSFVDGLGIGLSFQAGAAIGWVVSVAVLTHDLADGLNTVSLSLGGRTDTAARGWLLVNGAAPLVGVLLGLHASVPPATLALLLGGFAGAFLYIGAGELLPRSYKLDPRPRMTVASLGGIAIMALATSLVR